MGDHLEARPYAKLVKGDAIQAGRYDLYHPHFLAHAAM